MAKTIFAPKGVDNFSYQGELYRITNPDGSILVPDACAAIMVESHGFRRSPTPDVIQQAVIVPLATPAADDDEDVTEDTLSEILEPVKPSIPSPAEFTMRMTQADMKAFLRQHGVTIPGSIKVKDLRKLVEDTYEAVMTAPAPAEEPKTDEPKTEG